MTQMTLSLLAVLAMVFAAAWAFKRLQLKGGPAAGLLRIVAGASVGQRERVLVLEVHDTWLVVGVAAGQVRALHSMPRPADAAIPASPAAAGTGSEPPRSFAELLRGLRPRT